VSSIASAQSNFDVIEATIEGIQNAIQSHQITATDLVNLYLQRIKAYNGVCVNQPQGILGPISTIPHAGKINALITLNLRPATRQAWGFDARKARSMTDSVDNNPNMPDAFEVAAALDAQFAQTGKLVGPLHGVVLAIKDQYDTFDMRSTAGADAFYANDRPPKDATFVTRLRAAGAIIVAKANMGEYASGGVPGTRSSFGGTLCNPYDTERDPGVSSGGSGMSVAANLVTCAIGEESGTSVRMPAKNNSAVGLAPTRELVSASGMIQRGIVTRVGPICRTVKDVARILDVYAGFDPGDELTSFSRNRKPPQPYYTYANATRLDGMRIGVIREYMRKDLFTVADAESIDIVNKAIQDLGALGATIVDPGPTGALFQGCFDKAVPAWRNRYFTAQFPTVFPTGTDFIPLLAGMYLNLALVPHTSTGQPNVRNIGPTSGDAGDAKYNLNTYLAQRGDANIRAITDILSKSNFWTDPVIPNLQGSLTGSNADLTLADQGALETRFALRTAIFKCFADMNLDAVVYPTGSVPPAILTAPREPTVNDRGSTIWTQINSRGFPAMTVPAGFTTVVYDRDASSNLLPAKAAKLPVGIDFLGLPFSEPKLFQIASAYEAATHNRVPPPDFGALTTVQPMRVSAPRPMPQARTLRPDELREIKND
jgi:Asp-tRNA(Asn)/Glu-tRNA(Gln) amidotransferase A subunit family amidase